MKLITILFTLLLSSSVSASEFETGIITGVDRNNELCTYKWQNPSVVIDAASGGIDFDLSLAYPLVDGAYASHQSSNTYFIASYKDGTYRFKLSIVSNQSSFDVLTIKLVVDPYLQSPKEVHIITDSNDTLCFF